MKRYLLFAGDAFCACGGANDLISYSDDLEKLKKDWVDWVEKQLPKGKTYEGWIKKPKCYDDPWGHILDTKLLVQRKYRVIWCSEELKTSNK